MIEVHNQIWTLDSLWGFAVLFLARREITFIRGFHEPYYLFLVWQVFISTSIIRIISVGYTVQILIVFKLCRWHNCYNYYRCYQCGNNLKAASPHCTLPLLAYWWNYLLLFCRFFMANHCPHLFLQLHIHQQCAPGCELEEDRPLIHTALLNV